MEPKTERKPYRPPQIATVLLRREQAVLSQCRTGVTAVMQNSNVGCGTTCKRSNGTGNSAAAAS